MSIAGLRLNRLKSVNLCKKLIKNKLENQRLPEEIINAKSIGLSSTIESALGYWEQSSKSLNAKVLSRYYFLLQLTIAEQVSSVNNTDDLASIQKHTEYGHGLGTIRNYQKSFPEDYHTFFLKGGHFYSYMKSIGQNPKRYSLDKRPRKFEELDDLNKIINIDDLFRSVPELNNVIEEYTNKLPLSFRLGYSSKNNELKLEAAKKMMNKTGKSLLDTPEPEGTKTSIITFYENSDKFSKEYFESFNLPFYDYHLEYDTVGKKNYIAAKFDHESKVWHQELHTYSSNYSPTCIIAPLFGIISDPIIINYSLLYTLSIIVRYLPDLWYEVMSGKLDHYGSLIEYYISVFDHVIPLEMLQRITGTKISIHQPGSLFGPI